MSRCFMGLITRDESLSIRWEPESMLHWVGESECASPLVKEDESEENEEQVEVWSEWKKNEETEREKKKRFKNKIIDRKH